MEEGSRTKNREKKTNQDPKKKSKNYSSANDNNFNSNILHNHFNNSQWLANQSNFNLYLNQINPPNTNEFLNMQTPQSANTIISPDPFSCDFNQVDQFSNIPNMSYMQSMYNRSVSHAYSKFFITQKLA